MASPGFCRAEQEPSLYRIWRLRLGQLSIFTRLTRIRIWDISNETAHACLYTLILLF
jgi:hypothetical protein